MHTESLLSLKDHLDMIKRRIGYLTMYPGSLIHKYGSELHLYKQ